MGKGPSGDVQTMMINIEGAYNASDGKCYRGIQLQLHTQTYTR